MTKNTARPEVQLEAIKLFLAYALDKGNLRELLEDFEEGDE